MATKGWLKPRLLLFTLIATASFACQTVTGVWQPSATPTPSVTFTLTPSQTPTLTFTPSPVPASPTPTASHTPTEAPRQSPSPLQLQVFQELWEAVNQNYLYPDFNGVDWAAVYEQYYARVAAGMSNEEFYLAMDEMIALLGDEHSIFFSPEEAAAQDAGYAGEYNYVGIGILSSVVIERKRTTILLVFPGSPAEEAGLQAHDSILAADGQPIIDENGFRRDLLRGPEGSVVVLTVQSPGQEARQVTVTRRKINATMPVPHQVLTTPSGKRVGYIFLITFNDSTIDARVQEALEAMSAEAPLDGIIIDNRHNGGGTDVIFSSILSFFTHGRMGYFIQRQFKRSLEVKGQDIHGSQDIPLVVLVGEGTASFGEIFSGILKDINRAYLIGQLTDGNVEILFSYEFSDGSRAWIAEESFRPLNHPEQNWEQTGIIPDLTVISNWDEVTLETDPVVHAALDYLDNQP